MGNWNSWTQYEFERNMKRRRRNIELTLGDPIAMVLYDFFSLQLDRHVGPFIRRFYLVSQSIIQSVNQSFFGCAYLIVVNEIVISFSMLTLNQSILIKFNQLRFQWIPNANRCGWWLLQHPVHLRLTWVAAVKIEFSQHLVMWDTVFESPNSRIEND